MPGQVKGKKYIKCTDISKLDKVEKISERTVSRLAKNWKIPRKGRYTLDKWGPIDPQSFSKVLYICTIYL